MNHSNIARNDEHPDYWDNSAEHQHECVKQMTCEKAWFIDWLAYDAESMSDEVEADIAKGFYMTDCTLSKRYRAYAHDMIQWEVEPRPKHFVNVCMGFMVDHENMANELRRIILEDEDSYVYADFFNYCERKYVEKNA